MTEVISLSLSCRLKEQIDKIRGDVTRSKFITRTLETAIKRPEKDNGDDVSQK
jgi:metal-responsive CopG/Arc/MetJ family transcriptional regulator